MLVPFAKGFRPFFLVGALWAVIAVPLWILVLRGVVSLPPGMVDAYWHAHEMLHGFAIAIVVGFLLTAVSNWTSRPTATGPALAALVALWVAGRVVFLPGIDIVPWVRATADLALLPAVIAVIARPIVSTRNRRNYGFPFLLAALWSTNLVWHLGAMGRMQADAPGIAMRVALDVLLVIIAVVTGRIIPAFTRNATRVDGIASNVWADRVTVAGLVALAALDATTTVGPVPRAVAGITAVAALVRSLRWGAWATLREPLLWILHVGHAWLAVGLALRALEPVLPGIPTSAATHALAIGAVGSLVIGMIARVALGHTGRELTASRVVSATFVLVVCAAAVRVGAALFAPAAYRPSLDVVATLWTAAFATYLVVFTPILLAPRPDGNPG